MEKQLPVTETWGLLMDWIGNDFSDQVVSAVQAECRRNGRSLVVMTLGLLHYQLDEQTLTDQILPFLNDPRLDRLVIGSSQLQRNGGSAKYSRILGQAKAMPVVSLGGGFDHCLQVRGQYGRAFRELLEHLWVVHGYRRFAWVGGPPDNPVAQDRRDCLLGFLADKGTGLGEGLDLPGNFNLAAGQEAGRYLVDRQGEFDVVVAANDAMALGVREVLGDLVPVTGFDNAYSAARTGLTTVAAGIEAEVGLALGWLGDCRPRERVAADLRQLELGQVIFRASCGCPVRQEANRELGPEPGNTAQRVGTLFEEILGSRDMSELSGCLNRGLPIADIAYWRLLPPVERGEGSTAMLELPPENELEADIPVRQEMMVHSLFRGQELFGYLIHDISNQNYLLSEWLRINVCLVLEAWQREGRDRQVQRLLRDENERHARRQRDIQMAIDSLPGWIVELDRNLHIRYANSGFRRLLGADPGERPHGPLVTCLPPADRLRTETRLLSALRHRQDGMVEFRLENRQGGSHLLLGEIQILAAGQAGALAGFDGQFQFQGGMRIAGIDLQMVIGEVRRPEDTLLRHFALSPRERQMVGLVATGMGTPEMARRLGIAESTVRVVLHKLYAKTGVSKRQEFLELLTEYHARAEPPGSLTKVLLDRLFGER